MCRLPPRKQRHRRFTFLGFSRTHLSGGYRTHDHPRDRLAGEARSSRNASLATFPPKHSDGPSWNYVSKHRVSQAFVLITPRNEENPYLTRLRDSLAQCGVPTEWFAMDATGSQTLNALLFPVALTIRRIRGARVLHLHWAYNFAWPWTRRIPFVRALPRRWFGCCLAWADLIGVRIVFTWHDLLPLTPTFDDDRAGRRPLVKRSRGMIAITHAAKLSVVHEFGVAPDRIDVIPEGPPVLPETVDREAGRRHFDVRDQPLIVAYGHIEPYKGIDDLLSAVRQLRESTSFSIRLLGASSDEAYATSIDLLLEELTARGRDAEWQRGRFTDQQLELLLAAADLVVIPFRRITNSATLRMAMAWRRPIILPDLPSLADIPREACFWFDPTVPSGLRDVLEEVLGSAPGERESKVEQGAAWVASWPWDKVGTATRSVYASALGSSTWS